MIDENFGILFGVMKMFAWLFLWFPSIDFAEDSTGYKFGVPIRTVFDPIDGVYGSLQLPTSAGNG